MATIGGQMAAGLLAFSNVFNKIIALFPFNNGSRKDPSIPPTDGTPVLNMPDEILLEVLSYADIADTVVLRMTCQRFRMITPTLQHQERDAVTAYLLIAENALAKANFYACFRCRSFKHENCFANLQLVPPFYKRHGAKRSERLCVQCRGSTHINHGMTFRTDGGTMGKCNCGKVTVEYCHLCKICYDCASNQSRNGIHKCRSSFHGAHRWNGYLTKQYIEAGNGSAKQNFQTLMRREHFLGAMQWVHEHDRKKQEANEAGFWYH